MKPTLYSIYLDEICDNAAKKHIQLPSDPSDPSDDSWPVHLQRYKILGTCNGLLCLGHYSAACSLSGIIFLNPLTQKQWRLPLPPFRPKGEGYFYQYGFGYDEASDEYKLVVLDEIGSSNCGRENIKSHDVLLYSLKSSSWKKLPIDQAFTTYMLGNGVFGNNAVHWLMRDSSVLGDDVFIGTFDLSTEKFSKLPLPLPETDFGNNNTGCHISLGSLGGCLSAVFYAEHNGYLTAEVLQMNEGSWKPFAEMKLPCVGWGESVVFTPVACWNDGSYHHLLLQTDRNSLILHTLEGNSTKVFDIAKKQSQASWDTWHVFDLLALLNLVVVVML